MVAQGQGLAERQVERDVMLVEARRTIASARAALDGLAAGFR